MTNLRPLLSMTLLLALCGATVVSAQGTQQQTLVFQPGWNAIHLEVEPEDRAIEAVFGAANCSTFPSAPPIASVWTYDGRFGRVGSPVDPAQGLLNATGWFGWFPETRPESVLTSLFALQIHRAYLVRLDGTLPVTCTVTGVPRYVRQRWVADSFNLVGFYVEPPPNSASFETWFAPSAAHDGQAIFRLDASGFWQAVQPAFESINPGEAYWVYTRGASNYQGPLEIDIAGADVLDYSDALEKHDIVFKNRLDIDVAVTIRQLPSSTPVGLKYEQFIPDTAFHWPDLPTPHVLSVGAEDDAPLTVAPDRSTFSGRADQVMEITNGLGSRLLLPLGADASVAGDYTGLWTGSVHVREVGALRCTATLQEVCGTSEPAPAEVQNLGVDKLGGTDVSVTWDPVHPDLRYDVAGSGLAELAAEGGVYSAPCLADHLSQSAWTDTSGAPPPGGEYYLLRSRNSTAVGSYGSNSQGDKRSPLAACGGEGEPCESTMVYIGVCEDGVTPCNSDLGSADCAPGDACLYCDPADATPTPVGNDFLLSVLVHVDDNGQARLLKEVIQMVDPPCRIPDPDTPGYETVDPDRPGTYVLLTDEDRIPEFDGVALREGVSVGARISTAAFDFDETSGADWDEPARAMRMTGTFGTGPLVVAITLPSEFPTNPFRHKFHPDHDNVPVAEAPELERQIQLTFESDYAALGIENGQFRARPRWGNEEVGGYYQETIQGLHRQPVVARGIFRLRRAAKNPVLNPDPQTCSP